MKDKPLFSFNCGGLIIDLAKQYSEIPSEGDILLVNRMGVLPESMTDSAVARIFMESTRFTILDILLIFLGLLSPDKQADDFFTLLQENKNYLDDMLAKSAHSSLAKSRYEDGAFDVETLIRSLDTLTKDRAAEITMSILQKYFKVVAEWTRFALTEEGKIDKLLTCSINNWIDCFLALGSYTAKENDVPPVFGKKNLCAGYLFCFYRHAVRTLRRFNLPYRVLYKDPWAMKLAYAVNYATADSASYFSYQIDCDSNPLLQKNFKPFFYYE